MPREPFSTLDATIILNVAVRDRPHALELVEAAVDAMAKLDGYVSMVSTKLEGGGSYGGTT